MIRTLEDHGVHRKNIAALLDVSISYVNHVMSDSSSLVMSAKYDRMLMALCASVNEYQHIEVLLPFGSYVTEDGADEADGSYLDELLASQETLGDTTKAVKHHEHMHVRDRARIGKKLYTRMEAEAALKLRKIHGNGLFDTTAAG